MLRSIGNRKAQRCKNDENESYGGARRIRNGSTGRLLFSGVSLGVSFSQKENCLIFRQPAPTLGYPLESDNVM